MAGGLGKCPFQGLDAADVTQSCLLVNCEIWDVANGECSINIIKKYMIHTHDSHSHIINHLYDNLEADGGEVPVEHPYEMSTHLHNAHLHKRDHMCEEKLSDECGGGEAPSMPAAKLVNEHMGNNDEDGNGLVYGVDFIINPTDPDKPPMLQKIEQSPDFNPPSGITKMTWSEFLATL